MFKETHCQVANCPHGKKPNERCRFNDAETNNPDQEVRLRVKCRRDSNEYVIASTKPVINVA